MGAKYTSVTITGYNASPPPDDGSTSASNQLTWAKHKTKIGDPIKTAVEAINSALVTALDTSSRLITSNDNSVAGDNGKTIVIGSTVTTAVTLTLMDAATAAAGYIVTVANESASVTCTVGRATASNTISAVTSDFSLPPLTAITFVVSPNGTGYSLKSQALSVATQAMQEAGSSITASVTPGRQQYHPSAAKGWCSAGVSGNINAAYNVTSVTDGGAGKATINWTVVFTGSYAMMATALTSTGTSLLTLINSATFSVASSEINTITSTTGALADPDAYSIAAFGDQA